MTRTFRTFQFDGQVHALDASPGAREADLRDRTLTLIRETDGSRRVIRAEDVNVPLPAAVRPPAPGSLYDFRALVEEALALEFTDAEVIEILEIARRHGLLRVSALPEDES